MANKIKNPNKEYHNLLLRIPIPLKEAIDNAIVKHPQLDNYTEFCRRALRFMLDNLPQFLGSEWATIKHHEPVTSVKQTLEFKSANAKINEYIELWLKEPTFTIQERRTAYLLQQLSSMVYLLGVKED